MARGEPESSGHVAGDLCELRRGGARGGVGNATSPVLGYGNGVDVEVEDVEAELEAGWLGRRRRGELGQRCRSTAELAKAKWRRERALGRRNEDGRGSGWRHGVQVKAPGLTGGVAVDVRPPRVVHASVGR